MAVFHTAAVRERDLLRRTLAALEQRIATLQPRLAALDAVIAAYPPPDASAPPRSVGRPPTGTPQPGTTLAAVLETLQEDGPGTAAEIAARLDLPPHRASAFCANLRTRGLVTVTPAPVDDMPAVRRGMPRWIYSAIPEEPSCP